MAPSLQPMTAVALVDAIDRLLPQTQCRRCGYDDCHAYAGAIARGEAAIDLFKRLGLEVTKEAGLMLKPFSTAQLNMLNLPDTI